MAVFAIIGRFCVNISYNIGLQYAAELLPTVVRAQGVALIHIMGYVASILAPFVVYLVSYHSYAVSLHYAKWHFFPRHTYLQRYRCSFSVSWELLEEFLLSSFQRL